MSDEIKGEVPESVLGEVGAKRAEAASGLLGQALRLAQQAEEKGHMNIARFWRGTADKLVKRAGEETLTDPSEN